jgi:MtrB/PioB family decaheme-associated outer membrane protein
MNKKSLVRTLKARPTLLSLALLAAFGSAVAQDKADKTQVVDASITVGGGLVSGDRQDRALFDQYSGLTPSSNVFGIFGGDYYRRDDKTGTMARFQATELLTGNRELGFLWKRQGDWSFSADYSELRRYDPYTPNTALIGGGADRPQVVPLLGGPGTGGDMDLKTKRTGLGFGFSKIISRQAQFDASIKTENKEGARLFGIGMACPTFVAPGCGNTTGAQVGSAVLMIPEPIDANHTQAEARLSFSADRLSVSVGYYGSFYHNNLGSLNPNVPGSLYNPLGSLLPLAPGLQPILNQPVALPPDNQSHQLDLTGAYAFSRTTNLNFKVAYSRATQQENFASSGFAAAPGGVGDLDGRLSTMLAQVGLSARPTPKLSLHANLRYEDRDDSTPLALYGLIGAAPNTGTFTNRHYPLTTLRGKLEAGYQFTPEYKGTLSAVYNSTDRGVLTPSSAVSGITALRAETDETTLKAELRKRMAEDLSGAISFESGRRDGSNWLRDNSGRGVTEEPDTSSVTFQNGIFPVNLADRRREKVKINADWQATEQLALQASAEAGRDRYDTPSAYGVREAGLSQLSLDWNYAVNDNWGLTGFISRGQQELDQARPGAAYMAFDNTSNALGIGLNGRISSKWEVGGSLSYLQDKNVYAQTLDATADLGSAALLAATGGLPTIDFRQTQLRLFGKYTIDKQSNVRLDFLYQHSRWNDWAYSYNGTPYVYSDGTTVNYQTSQNVGYLGVSYTKRWQ